MQEKNDTVNVKNSKPEKDETNVESALSEKDETNIESILSEKDETGKVKITIQEKDDTENVKNSMTEKDETRIVSVLSEKDETLSDTNSLLEIDSIIRKQSLTHTQSKTFLFENEAENDQSSLSEQNTYNGKNCIFEKDETINENLLLAKLKDKSVLEKDKTMNVENTFQEKDETLNVDKNISEQNEAVNIESSLSGKGDTFRETSILSDKDVIAQEQNLSHAQSRNSLFEKEAANYDISLLEGKETSKESLNSKSSISEKEEAKNQNVLDAELHVKSALKKDKVVNSENILKDKNEAVNVKNNMSDKDEKVETESTMQEKGKTVNVKNKISEKNETVDIEPEKAETLYETSSLSDKDDSEQKQNLSHDHSKNRKEAVNGESDLLKEKETLNAKICISEKVKNETLLDADLINKGVLGKDFTMNNENTLQENDETLNVTKNMSEVNEIALLEISDISYAGSSLSDKHAIIQEPNLSLSKPKDSLFRKESVNDESALLQEKKSLNATHSTLEKDKAVNIENLQDAELNDKDVLEKDETMNGEIILQEKDKTITFKNVSEKNDIVKVESALSEKSETLRDTSNLSDKDGIVQNQNVIDAKENDSLFEKEAVNDESALLEENGTLYVKSAFFEKEEITINENLLNAELTDKKLLEKVNAVCGESTLQQTDKSVNCKNSWAALREKEETVNFRNMSENETINIESAWSKTCDTLNDTSSLSDRDAIVQNQNLSHAQPNSEKEEVNGESVLLEKVIVNVTSSTFEKETVTNNLLDAGLEDKSELEKVKTLCVASTLHEKDEALNSSNMPEKDEIVNGENALQENAETLNMKNNISRKEAVNIETAFTESESLYVTSSLSDTNAIEQSQKLSHITPNLLENCAINNEEKEFKNSAVFSEEKDLYFVENYILEKDRTINENILNVEPNKSSLEKDKTMKGESSLQEKDEILNVKNNKLEKYDMVNTENICHDEVETVNIWKSMLEENKDVNSGIFLPVKDETINAINCMTEDEIVNNRNVTNAESDTYLLEKHETRKDNSNLEDTTVKLISREKDTENGVNTFPAKGEDASANVCMMEKTVSSKQLLEARDISCETIINEKGSLTETYEKPAGSCGNDLGDDIRLSKLDAVVSEQCKSVERSDSEEDAHLPAYCTSKRQKNMHDNSLGISEVDCAPTRSRRNIRNMLSKDVIPENSILKITENTKPLTDRKLSPISRSLRSKSLDPPAVEHVSDDAKPTEGASLRKKRAQTPEVKLKTEEKKAIRSSPRKAAKSIISYKEDSRRIPTPSILISRPKMPGFKTTQSSSSVATLPSDTSLLKEALSGKNELKIDEKIKNGSSTSKKEYKSVDQSHNEERAHTSSHGASTCKKNIRDVSVADSALTRTTKNIRRYNLSKDVIPENSIMKLTGKTEFHPDRKLPTISRSLRSKSLDPPEIEPMSNDAKSDRTSEAASSRKKRAQTPEVKLKTEAKVPVRSSPRKAAKSIISYKEDCRKAPSSTSKS